MDQALPKKKATDSDKGDLYEVLIIGSGDLAESLELKLQNSVHTTTLAIDHEAAVRALSTEGYRYRLVILISSIEVNVGAWIAEQKPRYPWIFFNTLSSWTYVLS